MGSGPIACPTLRYGGLTYTPGISCSSGTIARAENTISRLISTSRKSGIRHHSSEQKSRPHSYLIPSCFPSSSFFLMVGFLCSGHAGRSMASPTAAPCQARLLARQPPADRSGTGGRSSADWLNFPRPGLPHTRGRLRKKKEQKSRAHNPPAHGGRLFNWGLSSKAPKPLWIVYVPDASRADQPTTQAYIQPENGCLFQSKQDVHLCHK